MFAFFVAFSIHCSASVARLMEHGDRKSIANCAILSAQVDRLYVYDNSRDNKEPLLLFRASNGDMKKKYHTMRSWANEIFGQLSPKF